jgi:hypothetical protein
VQLIANTCQCQSNLKEDLFLKSFPPASTFIFMYATGQDWIKPFGSSRQPCPILNRCQLLCILSGGKPVVGKKFVDLLGRVPLDVSRHVFEVFLMIDAQAQFHREVTLVDYLCYLSDCRA